MESQPLLPAPPLEQNSEFWVRLRRKLVLLFWVSYAAMCGVAVVLVVRSYETPPTNSWYRRRVLCSYLDLPEGNLTDLRRSIRGASLLGCGGVLLRMTDMRRSARNLVTEGHKYDIRILLDFVLSEETNRSQEQTVKDAVRRWIQDGVSGFSLAGGHREALMTVVESLEEELDGVRGDERIVLLPDWLGEEAAINKSRFLRTRPVRDWKPWEASESSEVMKTAWEVSYLTSPELQFMALTLPGTIKLSLSQTHPPPSWLRPLLFLRHQNPALYAGWLQTLSENSTHNVLSHWGCSTLLIAINPSNQSQVFPLHLPNYTASAKLLLSTQRGHNGGKMAEDGVLLAPREAQLLRLTPQK